MIVRSFAIIDSSVGIDWSTHFIVTLPKLLQLRAQSFVLVSKPPVTEKGEQVKQTRYPIGCNQERVRKLLLHYETQLEDEAVAEDEAVFRRRARGPNVALQ